MNTHEVPKTQPQSGPALRDMFAAAALQGLVASNFYDRYKVILEIEGTDACIPRIAASIAYEYADALLAYREISKS